MASGSDAPPGYVPPCAGVLRALAGSVGSAEEHFRVAGAMEGRAANPATLRQTLARAALLREKMRL